MNKSSLKPTAADVAKLARVGAITVSRVVNGIGYVSNEKKKRIQDAIRTLGYVPNQAARVLKGNRARIIGLIIPDLADPFFSKCAAAVETYAASQGYMTLILTAGRNPEMEEHEVSMIIHHNVAGMIVVPSFGEKSFEALTRTNIPLVALDRPLGPSMSDEVVVENLGGAQVAVNHLIEHGHKKIACVGYDENTYAISHRVLGYTQAMKAAKLRSETYLEIKTLDDALKLVRRWKKSKFAPTAVFALNNVATKNLLLAFREEEVSVPDQIAIIGFDEPEMAELLSAPLTVVRQPAAELGIQAARILFERIGSASLPRDSFGVKLVLPVEFVIRESCGSHSQKKQPAVSNAKARK